MPQKINIQGLQDINDPFYRYQMDKFILVKEKNKLVINNFDKVCQDIKRSPKLLIDYYKKKFGISIVYKDTKVFLPSNFDQEKIISGLREFIDIYVLCEKCQLPETNIDLQNNKIILSCDCCGFISEKNIK